MRRREKLAAVVAVGAAFATVGTPSALAAYEVADEGPSSIADGEFDRGFGVECTDGVSVSGGMLNNANYADGVYITEMLPLNPFEARHRSWTVGADNYPGGDPSNNVAVQAICDLQNGWNDYNRIERDNAIKVPDDRLGGGTVMCPAGNPVVGGAYDESGFFDEEAYVSTSAPVDGNDPDKIPDDGWRVEVYNDEDGTDGKTVKGTMTVNCDKRRGTSAIRYTSDQKNVPDASQGILSLGCRDDETVISGGAE